MTDLTSLAASELVRLIASRKVSPVEVMQAHLQSVERLNSKLNAIVTLSEDAMDRAQAAERAIMSGRQTGPLHGLPVTIKDTIETKGLKSTSGSRRRAQYVPSRDASAVRLLKEAGAIVLGKTNSAELAMEYTAENAVFGRTNHPHDPSLTPGGSSGGEAAAIASGMSPAGLGTDLAGSIRVPAHFCGIAGLKPAVGSIPGDGQFPPATGPYSLAAVIGPMARTVSDLRFLFEVLAQRSCKVNLIAGTQVAFYTDDDTSVVTDETRKAVTNAARILADAGLTVREQRPPGVERGYELWMKLFSWASVLQLRNVYGDDGEDAGDFARWRLAKAQSESSPMLDDFISAWVERDRLRFELLKWMAATPLLLAPVGATPAYAHGTRKLNISGQTFSTFRAFSYCQTFNVFDLPVAVIRAGTSPEGLPIGVQVAGRPFEEATVLAAAQIIEHARL